MLRERINSDLVIVLVLFLAALALRIYQLPQIPPGLHSDEAYNGLDVLDILNGQRPIFFERNNGREPLYIYLQAISVALLGTTPLALRLVSAIVGAVTVPAVYWSVVEAFAGTALGGRRVAVWTALLLAGSYWHLNFSRIGYRAIMLPLMTCLVCGWFWRAWRKLEKGGRPPWLELAACGAFTGLALYTYTSARVVPLLVVALVLAGATCANHTGVTRRRAFLMVAAIGCVAVLVFAPLGVYFLAHPSSFFGRAASVLIPASGDGQGSSWQALGLNIVKTAGIFGAASDMNWRHNPAARPAFDLLVSAWAVIGVAWVIVARRHSLPHLWGVLWLVVLALPALISDGAPHTLRAIGIVPAGCLLAAISMLETGDWLAGSLRSPSRSRFGGTSAWLPALAAWLPLPFLVLSGITGIHGYFNAFRSNANAEYAFDTRYVALAPLLQSNPDLENAWLIPSYPIFNLPHPDVILNYLAGRGSASTTIVASEDQASAKLREVSQSYLRATLVEAPGAGMEPDGAYALVDWKHIIRFLLLKYGRVVGEQSGPSSTYQTYSLSQGADYQVSGAITPLEISFGGQVKLAGIDYGATVGQEQPGRSAEARVVPAGQPIWAVLRWRALSAVERDLKVSLLLTDEAGHLAGQVDDTLAGDNYVFERQWRKDSPASTFHIVPLLPAIPPGRYFLHVAVYDARTLERLPVMAGSDRISALAAVGEVEVTRSALPPAIEPQFPAPQGGSLSPELVLLGFDLPAMSVAPGSLLTLTSYWQARGPLPAGYQLSAALELAEGTVISQTERSLVRVAIPIGAWQSGDTVRSWLDLRVPAAAQAGKYRLIVSAGASGGPAGRVDLGEIEVAGRPRQFTLPAVGYPLQAQLGSQAVLRGYDLETSGQRSGENLKLTLYWEALVSSQRSYVVFVHLLNGDGQVVAQKDSVPGEGTLPTTGWLSGEFIADQYVLALAGSIPAGTYRLEAGMYDPDTGVRLPVSGADGQAAGDRVLLPEPIQILAK